MNIPGDEQMDIGFSERAGAQEDLQVIDPNFTSILEMRNERNMHSFSVFQLKYGCEVNFRAWLYVQQNVDMVYFFSI